MVYISSFYPHTVEIASMLDEKAHCSHSFLHDSIWKKKFALQQLTYIASRNFYIQQDLELHGLKKHWFWKYTVSNFAKYYTFYHFFGTKPQRYMVFKGFHLTSRYTLFWATLIDFAQNPRIWRPCCICLL